MIIKKKKRNVPGHIRKMLHTESGSSCSIIIPITVSIFSSINFLHSSDKDPGSLAHPSSKNDNTVC